MCLSSVIWIKKLPQPIAFRSYKLVCMVGCFIYTVYACVFIAKHCDGNKNKSNNIMMWKNVPTTNKKTKINNIF